MISNRFFLAIIGMACLVSFVAAQPTTVTTPEPTCPCSGVAVDKDFYCLDKDNGDYRSPSYCDQFITCSNGFTEVNNCAPSFPNRPVAFNPETDQCDFQGEPDNIGCNCAC